MPLIYPLIIITAISIAFSGVIRKKPSIFYSLATLIATFSTVIEFIKMNSKIALPENIAYLEKLSLHGNYSIACFILVMFAGALNNKWTVTKKLLSIRAKLSIIGSILIGPHIIIYSFYFIKNLLSNKAMTSVKWTYTIVGIIAFLIMIPLFITSFKNVRAKMKGTDWKKLQRFAYAFYLLAYVHIIVILLNSKHIDYIRVYTYTIIFGLYLILRLLKMFNRRKLRTL